VQDEYSDEELMLRYGAGDVAAFEVLYRRNKGPLYRYIIRLLGTGNTAEELFQEVWANVVKARTNYTPTAKFKTYLFHIAHNKVMNHFRRQHTSAVAQVGEDDPQEDCALHSDQEPDQMVHRQSSMIRLFEVLDKLPDTQREVFVLREESGLSLQEIAEATGVTLEAAKSRLRYALSKLKEGLKDFI
jgi:RNA polymerase sigma-70 factor (ECF subfamily)